MFRFARWRRTENAASVPRLVKSLAVVLAMIAPGAHALSPNWETYFRSDFKGFDVQGHNLNGPYRLVPDGLELSDHSGFTVATKGSPISAVQVDLALTPHLASRTVFQIGFQYPGRDAEQAVAAQLELGPDGSGVVRVLATEGRSGKALRQIGVRGNVTGTWRFEVRYGHARVFLDDTPIVETDIYSGETGPSTVLIGCLHGTVRVSNLLTMQISVRQPLTSAEQQQVDNANALVGEADLAYIQGDYSSAVEKEKEALESYKRVLGDQSFSAGYAKANLGTFLNHTARLSEARGILEDAVASLRDSAGPDHPQTAAAELSLANSLATTRDFMQALPLAQHSLEVAQRVYGPDDPTLAAPLSAVAGIEGELGNFNEAATALRRAVKIRTDRFGTENIHIAPYLQQLAELELNAKDFDRAIADFETVKRIYSSQVGGDADGRVRAIRNLAHAYGRQDKADMMRSTLQEALSEGRIALSANDYRIGLLESDLATLDLLTGHPEPANAHARAALRIQLGVTLNAVLGLSEHEAVLAVGRLDESRDLFASTLTDDRGFISRADYALLSAARGLVTQVNLARLEAGNEISEEQQPQLRQQLSSVRNFLSGIALYNGRVSDDSRVGALVDMLTAEQERLERALYASLPAVAGRIGSERYLDQLLTDRTNQPGTIVVDFVASRKIDVSTSSLASVRWNTSYDVFIVGGPDTDKVTHLRLGPVGALNEAISHWLDDVRARRYSLVGTNVETESAFKVRDLLWTPIQKAFPDAKHVTVIPDGLIAKLPWSALPTVDGTHYLVEVGIELHTNLNVANSLVARGSVRRTIGKHVVLVGNIDYDTRVDPVSGTLETQPFDPPRVKWSRLPGTDLEIQKLSELAQEVLGRGAVSVLSGPAATEDAVEKALPDAWIVHLATHGYFADNAVLSDQGDVFQVASGDGGWRSYAESLTERSTRSPSMRNGLVLSGVNLGSRIDGEHFRIEKGILTAQEISDLDLRGVELTVLSACDSGLGTIEPGEGVFGLQRSLLMAGVRRVVASLWKVSDAATAEFMTDFYAAVLKSGRSPEDALQEVQLDWIKAQRTAGGRQRGPGEQTPVDPAAVAAAVVETLSKQGGAPADWAAFQLMGD